MILHASLIAARAGGAWRGVLIEGSAGAGKSSLALRALGEGFRLVADDRVVLWTSGGRLFGRAPEALANLLEVRGLDVVTVPATPLAQVALAVRCGAPERIPAPTFATFLGVSIPQVELDPREAAAPAKLSRALSHFDEDGKRRI